MSDISYELSGRVHKVFPVKNISEKFWLREFIVAVDEDTEYPQYPKIQVVKDKCNLITEDAVGLDIIVLFNVRGKLYNRKSDGNEDSFTVLDAWKLSLIDPPDLSGQPVARNERLQEQAAEAYSRDNQPSAAPAGDSGIDDIPF
jgi:hypothetical protein